MRRFKEIIGTIAPHIADLSGTEIWDILRQGGMLKTPGRKRLIEAIQTREVSPNDIQRFAAGEKGTAAEAILKGDEEGVAQEAEETIPEAGDDTEDGARDLQEAAAELEEAQGEVEPKERVTAILRAGEALARGVTHEESIEYLIRGRLGRLWNLYFEMEQVDLKKAR